MSRRPDGAVPVLILASGSPRRRELLSLLRIPHRVQPADIEEHRLAGESATAFVERAARDKALAVAATEQRLPVLAADTVVEIADQVLGKPRSVADAEAMLRRLSGRSHAVHTGVALAVGKRCRSLVDTAVVRFRLLTDGALRWYLGTGEPLDKAGAYAVQGAGGVLVERVEGSPHTVIGLPIHRLPDLFALVGLDFWDLLRSRKDLPPYESR